MEVFAIIFIVVGCGGIIHMVIDDGRDDFDRFEQDTRRKMR